MNEDPMGLVRSFLRHRAFLREAVAQITRKLEQRANEHDLSKLLDDEFEGFSRINAAARVHKFGSPEYAEGMRQEKGTIDLHFSRNRHHAEHPGLTGTDDLGPLDIIEMVCDWWAARRGYNDNRHSWDDTVAMNLQAKCSHLNDHQLWLITQTALLLEPRP